MPNRTRERTRPLIPMRHVSRLPGALRSQTGASTTECPHWLEGDDTAYAVEASDGSFEPLLPAGTILYATKRRTPHRGDLIIIDTADDQMLVRFVVQVKENAFETLLPDVVHKSIKREVVCFNTIKDLAVIAGTRRGV